MSEIAKTTTVASILPDGWRISSLGEVAFGKGEYGANVSKAEFNPALPRYVRITDISDQGSLIPTSLASISHEAAQGYLLHDGDLLFARSGATVGKSLLYQAHYGTCAFAGYLIRFRLDPAKIDPYFARNIVQSGDYWDWITTVQRAQAQPNINAQEYAMLPLMLPPLDEQRRIAEVLRSVDEAIAAAVAVQETTRSLLHSVRHNVFSEATKSVGLASIILLVSGQHVETAQCNKAGLGVPYLTGPSDFPDGEIIVTKFTTAPSVMCQPGDILITVKGSGVGKAVIADNSYCISRQLMAIRSRELPTAFLFEALQLVVEELNAEASGPIPGITRGHILVKPIPIIERAVQDCLAATFSSLREQIRLANDDLELLGILKSSLMADLLSGRVRVPA